MKRNWFTLVALALILTLALTGCGSKPAAPGSSGPSQPAGGDKLQIAMVYPDQVGLNPFHQVTQLGLEQAVQELNVDVKVIEAQEWGQIEENLRAVAADKKYDLIITSGFESADPLAKVAPEFPEQKFAIIDALVEADNVRSILWREHEAAFLLGAALGLTTETNKVGFVGPMNIPMFGRWTEGMQQGMKTTNPAAEMIINWTDSFEDVALAKEYALAQYNQGADIVAAVAGGGNMGVFEAAKEKGLYAAGQDTNQSVIDPEHILFSQVKRLDMVAYQAIEDLTKGQFTTGASVYGLKEGGVGFSHLVDKDAQRHPKLTDAVMQQLEELQNKVISGEIVVSDPLQQ